MSHWNSRGVGRGRGRVRNEYISRRGGILGAEREAPTTPAPPLGPLLDIIPVTELSNGAERDDTDAQIVDCELIASYNWLEKSGSSIVIPGMPPKWTPLVKARKLELDAGTYYRDQNAAQYPDHPMEPAVEAIMRLVPEPAKVISTTPIDIVVCGSTLGNLLRFVRGDAKPFRMLVGVVGTTVHLVRRENSPREIIHGVVGYGHTFPDAYTTWDASVRGSLSHQRILRYRFGGLGCLVRFEGDGYLPDKAGDLNTKNAKAKKGDGSNNGVKRSSIEDLMSSLAGNTLSSGALSGPGSALQVSAAGKLVPQRAVFDLKTRSIRYQPEQDFILACELPRLWLAQIPNFVLAYHASGTFTDIEVQDVRATVSDWERRRRPELSRFAALLRRIVDIARARKGEKLEITRDEGDDFLRIRKQMPDVGPIFKKDTEKRWEMWLGGRAADDGGKRGHDSGVDVRNKGGDDDDDDNDEVDSDPFDGASGRGNWTDDDSDLDIPNYTACDNECGYCGRCTY